MNATGACRRAKQADGPQTREAGVSSRVRLPDAPDAPGGRSGCGALSAVIPGPNPGKGSKRIGRNQKTGKPIILDDNDQNVLAWKRLAQ